MSTTNNTPDECIIEIKASRVNKQDSAKTYPSNDDDCGSLGLWRSNSNVLHFLKWVSNSDPDDVEHTLVTQETAIQQVKNTHSNHVTIAIPGITPTIAIKEDEGDIYLNVLTSAIEEIPAYQSTVLPLSAVVTRGLLNSLSTDDEALEELKTLLPMSFATTESVKKILSSSRLQETGRNLTEVLYNSSEVYSLFSALGLDPRILVEPNNLNGCYNNDATLKFIKALERLHRR